MLTTLKVIDEWQSAFEDKQPRSVRCLTEYYTNVGMKISSYKEVFEPWFVLQWVAYFTPIMVNFILIFNSTGQLQQLQIAYTVYNFSAFMFPYVCGTLMNYYHKKCHRIVQNTLQKLLKTRKSIWQNADLIPMNSDYQFIPSFFGAISIPINSTGHALTIFLTLLSFLLSLLTK